MTIKQPEAVLSAGRLRLIVMGAIAVLTVTSLLTMRAFTDLQKNAESLTRAVAVSAQIRTIEQLLLEVETGQRGFLLTFDEEALKIYRAAKPKLALAVDTLEEKSWRTDQEQIQTLRTSVDAKLEEIERTVELMKDGRRRSAYRIVASGEGQRVMEDARNILTELLRTWDNRSNERRERADTAGVLALASLGGQAVLTLTLISVLGFVVSRDRQARVEHASALAEANDRLEQKVAERTEALAKVNIELEGEVGERRAAEEELRELTDELYRSNAALNDFAFIASHDLQEPLRKIRAFGDRLEHSQQGLDERGRDFLRRMLSASERMSNLISALLEFSRVSRKGKPFEPLDLGEEMQIVLGDLEVAIEESNAVVTVGDLPAMNGDASQLRQVFQNLLSNALKFRQPDVAPRIDVSCDTVADRTYEIRVKDNGIGFDPKYAEKILAPFQRLHQRNAYPGTGIGLAICQRIAERHGGGIRAQSALGEGSTFVVTLHDAEVEEDGDDEDQAADHLDG